MEGREPMGLSQAGIMSPASSFSAILQRGVVVQAGGSPTLPASPTPPPGLHAPAPMRPGAVMSMPSNSPSTQYATEMAGGITTHPMPSSVHTGMNMAMVGNRGEPVKRKRGRPRKYGPDGSMALTLVSQSAVTTSASPLQKRGRGRPPGSGRKQQLAALGGWLAGTAGAGFTPHVITITAGEDVAMKIMSFSQQGPRAICILSANGAISNVTLRQPATSGGNVTYEGRFEILSLSGSFLPTENGGICSRTGGLSVSLAGPDGRVVGGGVAGLLMAASPVQVVVGSFLTNGKKPQPRPAYAEGPAAVSSGNLASPSPAIPMVRPSMNEALAYKAESPSMTSSSAHQPHNHSIGTVLHPMGWPGSQSLSDVRRNTDINISLPGG